MNNQEKISHLQAQPYMLNLEEGKTLHTPDVLVFMKASTRQTGGTFNLFEIVCPVGFATQMHIHYLEDVAIFVLEGNLTFFWGDNRKEAKAGSYFFQPKGIPHGFRVKGKMPVRILYLTIPAGIDQVAANATNSSGFFDAARHKIEVLGPLPD